VSQVQLAAALDALRQLGDKVEALEVQDEALASRLTAMTSTTVPELAGARICTPSS
jgi:hypothetical protein